MTCLYEITRFQIMTNFFVSFKIILLYILILFSNHIFTFRPLSSNHDIVLFSNYAHVVFFSNY